MGCIFCVMGKSASGKDTIYQKLMEREDLAVARVIPYTTRPIRDGEIPGETYHFCSEADVKRMEEAGEIIELRSYDTVYGIWKYFTANDGQIDLRRQDYLLIGTLETFVQIRKYFGADKVIPIYIQVEDEERLRRATAREMTQKVPKLEEMHRRFEADGKDFSEEKLQEAGIEKRFENISLEQTIQDIVSYIREHKGV